MSNWRPFGAAPPFGRVAPLCSSQACSALQPFGLGSAAFGGPASAAQPAGASRPVHRRKKAGQKDRKRELKKNSSKQNLTIVKTRQKKLNFGQRGLFLYKRE
ncbi:hypothetical protein SGRA_2334 [Saprospira grandis str. Lewin]|uniref:Uncharacterized protein n=1 Tax=Saprospira grandis (strain Lewin) TaxID=984262 RepID=H6L479_SAPGL|nr:hypothetical protein SGRA_2334 [Saprospira grandis str. Lewin]